MSKAPDARPALSLGQLAQGDDPLLIPITPASSVEEIARLVGESGASRVELLVPDQTHALRSAEGARALRDAAAASGVRLTIFTADDRIAEAAQEANLDVFGVGARVAAPRPRRVETTAVGQAEPARPVPPVAPPEEPVRTTEQAALAAASALELQALDEPPPPPEPQAAATMPGAAVDDSDLLSRLDWFENTTEAQPPPQPADEPARLGRSSEGALLFDTPGDLGVPRPAGYSLPETAADRTDAQPEEQADQPAAAPAEDAEEPVQPAPEGEHRPSMLGALFGWLPAGATAGAARARSTPRPSSAPKQALSARLAGNAAAPRERPTPTVEPQPRKRSFNPVWLLIPLLLLTGIVLVWFADIDLPSAAGTIVPGLAPTLEIAPPLRSTDAIQVPDTVVQLVSEPVADASSTAVQGIVLSAPVTIALEGTAATTALIPYTAATGTLLFSNPSSQPITIPAGTPVQANGLEFTFDEAVTVGGAVSDFAGTRNGQATAQLTARLPGGQGNIPAGAISNVPGYTGGAGSLRVLQEQPFTGGSDAEVVIVTPDDVSRLLPEALTRLYAKGSQDIDAALAQARGFELVQEATAPISPTQQMLAAVQLGDFEVFPAIGQVVSPELNGVFKMSMTRQFEALASPVNQPIDEQLRRAVANLRNREGASVTPDEVQITGWRRGDQGLHVDAVITPRAGYQGVPAERAEQIAASIRGRGVDEARAELDRLQSEGLIGAYRLPDGWQNVPDGVVVKLAPPAAPSAQP